MTLRTKLSLGLGFLFLIIFALAGFCSYYVGKSAHDAENILKDNYDSLVYARNMTSALDDMINSVGSTIFNPIDSGTQSDYYQKLFDSARKVFETNLKAESNNITEINEKGTVEKLNHDYELYLNLSLKMRSPTTGRALYFTDFLPSCNKLKQSINAIYDINMQAVVRKSELAKKDSAKLNNAMAVVATICFLLGLGYFWYFPYYISNTLIYLSKRMKSLLTQIGVVFDIKTRDEALVLLNAIIVLENKFGVKNLDKIE
jgi:two-component system, NtrC family, sensor histidine kinase KinB